MQSTDLISPRYSSSTTVCQRSMAPLEVGWSYLPIQSQLHTIILEIKSLGIPLQKLAQMIDFIYFFDEKDVGIKSLR